MNADPKADTKIQQVIKAVCYEWGVTATEVQTPGKRSTVVVTDARRAISYLIKHNNNVKVSRFVLAAVLRVNDAQVSKYVISMGRYIEIYDDIREKVENAVRNIPFMVRQGKIEFAEAA